MKWIYKTKHLIPHKKGKINYQALKEIYKVINSILNCKICNKLKMLLH